MFNDLKWANNQNREAVSKREFEDKINYPEDESGDIVRLGKILPSPDQILNPIPDDGYFTVKFSIFICPHFVAAFGL